MQQWWKTKKAAWGEIVMSIAVGGLATYLSPIIGIPIFLVMLIVGIFLLRQAYKVEGDATNMGQLGLHDIVPTLQKMDSYLREQAHIVAKKPYDKRDFADLLVKTNIEIYGFTNEDIEKVRNINKMDEALTMSNQVTKEVLQKYTSKSINWDETSLTIAGVMDFKGYGLKDIKSKGKYVILKNALTEYRNSVGDEVLNDYIEQHISDSEVLNTLIVIKERTPDITANVEDKTKNASDFVSSWFLARYETFELRVNKKMSDTRLMINKRINYLENISKRVHGQKKSKKKREQT